MEIAVENLRKDYGDQRAVDNISFDLHKGEILGFLGPNGAGKSTTMKIITGFMAPTSGNVMVNGQSIFETNDRFKRNIGYLPEHTPLYTEMYIIDYLEFVAKLQGVKKENIRDRINSMIVYCGLQKEKHKKIGELSKGYRQRVGLAQAMIHDPELLVLDEPTTGLDPNQIIEIRELIKKLGKQKTILLSTHILPEVEATCDRIIIINNGKIVADDTAEMLRRKSQGQELLRIQIESPNSGAEIAEKLRALNTVSEVEILDPDTKRYQIQSGDDQSSKKPIFQLCVDKGWFLLEMTEIETKLEDIFKTLTAE